MERNNSEIMMEAIEMGLPIPNVFLNWEDEYLYPEDTKDGGKALTVVRDDEIVLVINPELSEFIAASKKMTDDQKAILVGNIVLNQYKKTLTHKGE